jgi:hypothetical protein
VRYDVIEGGNSWIGHGRRPGVDPAQPPRFGDLTWRLSLMNRTKSVRPLVIVDWSRCPVPLRPALMRAAFAELHIPTPAVLLQQRASRSVTQPTSLRHYLLTWIRLARTGTGLVRQPEVAPA